MGRLLQLIAIAVVARVATNVIRDLLAPDDRKSFADDEPASPVPVNRGLMVRDPQCGVHIPESGALRAELAGAPLYFCSARCRDTYLESK